MVGRSIRSVPSLVHIWQIKHGLFPTERCFSGKPEPAGWLKAFWERTPKREQEQAWSYMGNKIDFRQYRLLGKGFEKGNNYLDIWAGNSFFDLLESPKISPRLEIEALFEREPLFKTVFMRFMYLENPSSFPLEEGLAEDGSDIMARRCRGII